MSKIITVREIQHILLIHTYIHDGMKSIGCYAVLSVIIIRDKVCISLRLHISLCFIEYY